MKRIAAALIVMLFALSAYAEPRERSARDAERGAGVFSRFVQRVLRLLPVIPHGDMSYPKP